MLNFKSIPIEDYSRYQNLTDGRRYPLCEYSFTDLFIWQRHYHVGACFEEDFFLAISNNEGKSSYIVPIGKGELRRGIEILRQDAAERQNPLRLHAVSEEMKDRLEELFPDRFAFTLDRDGSDYIYDAEKLMSLKGKKLQSKRNFVNRFQNFYQDRWEYQEIGSEQLDEVYKFHLAWCEENQACTLGNNSYQGETCAVYQALNHWEPLNLEGGLIRLDGKIIAFTIGCRHRPDMYIMQFEKADSKIAGAYQMINQQFAIRHFQDVAYVNREEDLGLEGLRKAKMSYRPLELGTEYRAIWKEDMKDGTD